MWTKDLDLLSQSEITNESSDEDENHDICGGDTIPETSPVKRM